MPKNGSELSSTSLSALTETANRNATMSIYQLPRLRKIDRTGSRRWSCPAEMFSTYEPLTMMQIPKKPANDGTSWRRIKEVPIRIAGVNDSIGTESERSDEDRALKIRQRPRMLRIMVTETAEKKSGPSTGNPRYEENKKSRHPPRVNPVPVMSPGSRAVMYFLRMMKYAALARAPRSAKKIQSMKMRSG
jgi:hypothetical protein